MSMTGDTIDNKLWAQFDYYSDEDGTNGAMAETLSAIDGNPWKVAEIRLHFSTAFASVEDFVIKVSSGSAINSYHNILFLSHAMNGSTDVIYQFSNPYLMRSDEHLLLTQSMASGVNKYGLRVIGWAVRG